MADSGYISKNLTQEQLRFMHLLNQNEVDYFNIYHIEEHLQTRFKNVNSLAENLVQKNILYRLQRGYYAMQNFNNEEVIGTFIAQNSAVAYWSALHKHGLTSRFPSKVFIQTSKRKKEKRIQAVLYQYVTVSENKRFGITSMGYGNNKFPITDVEKTIIDCFDLPQYAGGMDNLIQAFVVADLSSKKMMHYAEKINNISLTKRLGYLCELYEKKGMKRFVRYALSKAVNTYVLFEPGGENKGEFVSKWNLRLNISRESLLEMSRESY